MKTIRSRFATIPQTWEERIEAMRKDLELGEFHYLYFKAVLNLNDAKDNADYDRYVLIQRMFKWIQLQHAPAIESLLEQLEKVK